MPQTKAPQTKVRQNHCPKEFSMWAWSDDLWRHRLKIGVPPCFNVLFWLRDVSSVILSKLQHQRIGCEFSSYCLMNERFQCILKHPATICLDYVVRKCKWSKVEFCWKQKWPVWPFKFLLRNEGWPFQTWEDGNNWSASKNAFLFYVITKSRCYFPGNLSWHVTLPVKSTHSNFQT